MAKPKLPKSLFGRRLQEARLLAGIPQDKLGVMIGIDEGSSSARMSRYESGTHAPPFETVGHIARVLKLPTAYFYCNDDKQAELLRVYHALPEKKRSELLSYAKQL